MAHGLSRTMRTLCDGSRAFIECAGPLANAPGGWPWAGSFREGAGAFARDGATVRRDLARAWVRDGSLTLAEISCRLGYCDAAAFSRAFKRWTGEAPSAYRKAPRAEP